METPELGPSKTTYDASDVFRHEDSAGFVRLWGLGLQTWAAKQGNPES